MKTINLFIACSTSSETLNVQKERIVKLCKKLSAELSKEEQVTINSVAYDDLERRMKVFNNYIKRKADIVVFLVDNDLGSFLEEELEQAVKRGRKYRRPELLVYVSENIQEEPKQKIENILERGGWLYDRPSNTDDLLADVEKRIRGYVYSYDSIRKKQSSFRLWSWIACLLAVSAIVGCALLGYLYHTKPESKKLLIFGGGSARNYIEKRYLTPKGEQKKVELIKTNPEIWWYAPMPSGDAYRMIAENIINLEGDYKNSLYYPMIISAGKAESNSSFTSYLEENKFRERGVVIGVHLGNDTLVVYGSDSMLDSPYIYQSTLDTLILNKDSLLTIRKTSDNSGTFKSYLEICPSLKDYTNMPELFFSDQTLIEDEKWIAFGSAYYRPKNDLNSISRSFVKDSNDYYVFKKIYLYFVLYKDESTDTYMLPTATLEFLDKLKITDSIIDGDGNSLIMNGQINPKITSRIISETEAILFDEFIDPSNFKNTKEQ